MSANFAPPPLLGTLFINDPPDIDGWSETYYLKTAAYATGWTYLMEIARARMRMLCTDNILAFARVSATNVRGDSYTEPLPLFPGKNSWNAVAGTEDAGMPNNVVLWCPQRSANALVKATRPIHGIPKSLMEDGEDGRQFSPSPAWDKVFDEYAEVLKNRSVLVHVTVPRSGQGATTLVNAITADQTVISVDSGDQFPSKPRFGILIGTEVLNVIEFMSATVWRVLRAQDGSTAAAAIQGAPVKGLPLDKIVQADLTSISYPLRTRYRKVGRPFGLLQGRRAD